MKKIFFIICIVLSINSFSQCSLDGVSANLTLQLRHWYWAIGKIGDGTDSISRARMRAFRTQVIAANPPSETTSVQITNVPGEVIIKIYRLYIFDNTFAEYFNMGSTDAERRTIFTNIRALGNVCIQERITLIDAQAIIFHNSTLSKGKSIAKDD